MEVGDWVDHPVPSLRGSEPLLTLFKIVFSMSYLAVSRDSGASWHLRDSQSGVVLCGEFDVYSCKGVVNSARFSPKIHGDTLCEKCSPRIRGRNAENVKAAIKMFQVKQLDKDKKPK